MKTILTITAMLFAITMKAQVADTVAIRLAALDYIEGFYTADGARVAKAVHPELAKRIVSTDVNGNVGVQFMSASSLIFGAKRNIKQLKGEGPFKAKVTIYDVAQNIATIKITTNKFPFFDYCQMAKIDGQWKIINVLWAMNNPQPLPAPKPN
jgi:hypothetical protein